MGADKAKRGGADEAKRSEVGRMRLGLARRAGSRCAAAVLCGALLLLAGCMGEPTEFRDFGNPNAKPTFPTTNSPGNFSLFGLGGGGGGGATIGVNRYLWRASLDTISFMPLVSADPFGGVIITDWYTPLDSPFERFKMNVYILDSQLRVDGVKVNVFRQQLVDGREWKDAQLGASTRTELENAILTRARQLRIKALRGQ